MEKEIIQLMKECRELLSHPNVDMLEKDIHISGDMIIIIALKAFKTTLEEISKTNTSK